MAKKKIVKKEIQTKKSDDKILFAWLATFLSIIGFVIALAAKRNDKYVMYYAKQSLVIFIIAAILGIIAGIFQWIPVIGWIIYAAVTILCLVVWIMSWIYALSGKEKEIPIVSDWAKKINL